MQIALNGLPSSTRRRPHRTRQALLLACVSLLVTAGSLVSTGGPAAAGMSRSVQPTSVSWTDSHQPTTAFPSTDGTVPVGSWEVDGNRHRSRAYFTYDLSVFQGTRIIRALGFTQETVADDCTNPRAIELWRTDVPTSAPTWITAPAVREKIADIAPDAPCKGHLEVLVTEAIQQAVAAGRTSITFMARIAGDHEKNVHYGRWINKLGISIEANAAPDVPSELGIGGQACTPDMYVRTTTPSLAARLTDPDGVPPNAEPLTATFAWWPVDDPTSRTEWTSSPVTSGTYFQGYGIPAGQMVHGETYAFVVRATDGTGDSSAWSPACRFTIDSQPPPRPTVTSTDYPADGQWHVGVGIPGQFTFTISDSTDVVGYWYGSPSANTYVAAEPDGSATAIFAPTTQGINWLYVQSVDHAGNRSGQAIYEFLALPTQPGVHDGNPNGGLGEPRELTFSPQMTNVVEYVYRLNDGPEQTIAAGPDSTAKVTITPTQVGRNTVHVRSRTAAGLLSGPAEYDFVPVTAPLVSSTDYPLTEEPGAPAGTPGTFVFAPRMPGVVEYLYSFNYGAQQTVAAGPDGTASVVFTPGFAGYHSITVYSRTASGVLSNPFEGYFVAS